MPNKPVVLPQDPTKLTRTEKREALEAVKMIKENCTGKINGRTCANSSKQQFFLKYGEDFALPTISLEALFSSLIIEAHEGIYIATSISLAHISTQRFQKTSRYY